MVSYIGKIWKTGTSNVISVPAAFVKHGIVNSNCEYYIELRELPKPVKDALFTISTDNFTGCEI